MIPVLGRYGYRPELEFSATRTRGLGFRADRVKIGSFDVAPDSIWMSARGRS
jgi:hypothetical protein